jgi:hypothetical protein
MIAIRKARLISRVTAACVGLIFSMSACSDSSGPGELDSDAALQSLGLGIGAAGGPGWSGMVPVNELFDAVSPILDQVEITVDGRPQTMFALGLRESFPAGTCIEDVIIDPGFPPLPGECTPPPAGLALILWQSHSAFAPPDRMILIVADVGTASFDFAYDFPGPIELPAGVAMYVEGEDDVWMSIAGTLTSQVTATSQSCALPLPPYAKSGSCNIATFAEQGAITFEPMVDVTTIPSTRRLNVTIPSRTIRGLWQAITETQPYTPPNFQRASRWLGR